MDTETDPFVLSDRNNRHDIISLSLEVDGNLRSFVIKYEKEKLFTFGLLDAIASFKNILLWDATGDQTLFGKRLPNIIDVQQFFPSKSYGRQSLASVVLTRLGKHLNKSITCSRWKKWPLSLEEIVYSAKDAEVLWILWSLIPSHAVPFIFPVWEKSDVEDYKSEITKRLPIYDKFSDRLDAYVELIEGTPRPVVDSSSLFESECNLDLESVATNSGWEPTSTSLIEWPDCEPILLEINNNSN